MTAMFTEEELQALVSRKIFERGSAYYYEDNAVGRIQRTGDTFRARVEGTETYRVELTLRPGQPPQISCNCPYEYGEVCKHGIALGLAVLDWFGKEQPEETPAAPPAALTKQERRALLASAAWARTTDRERLAFLRQLLLQKPRLLRRFLAAFEFDKALLLAAAARPVAPPPSRGRRPTPRWPLTFLERAHELIRHHKQQELLPLLLSVDWLREAAGNNPPAWAALLAAAARAQPEATFDAVMERFESYLNNQTLRGSPLYYFIATCLRALAPLPALSQQVQLFASELMQQFSRLSSLRQALTTAGFFPIENEMATGLPIKRRGRKRKSPDQ